MTATVTVSALRCSFESVVLLRRMLKYSIPKKGSVCHRERKSDVTFGKSTMYGASTRPAIGMMTRDSWIRVPWKLLVRETICLLRYVEWLPRFLRVRPKIASAFSACSTVILPSKSSAITRFDSGNQLSMMAMRRSLCLRSNA